MVKHSPTFPHWIAAETYVLVADVDWHTGSLPVLLIAFFFYAVSNEGAQSTRRPSSI